MIIPLTRLGFCRTISVSSWPKPPTLGFKVNASSFFTVSPTFTASSRPLGIVKVTSPVADAITKVVLPASAGVIEVI